MSFVIGTRARSPLSERVARPRRRVRTSADLVCNLDSRAITVAPVVPAPESGTEPKHGALPDINETRLKEIAAEHARFMEGSIPTSGNEPLPAGDEPLPERE